MNLETKIDRVEQTPVVRVKGDIDLDSSPQLRKALNSLIEAEPGVLVLDMSQVSYIDSSGLATLVESLKKVRKNGGRLCLFGLNKMVAQAFHFTHLDGVFDIHPSLEEALKQ